MAVINCCCTQTKMFLFYGTIILIAGEIRPTLLDQSSALLIRKQV